MFRMRPGDTAPGEQMAEVSTVIRTIGDAFPTTQVYDVYLLALENVPGWWVYMDAIQPFVEATFTDLESRNPGLEFRTHWITKLGFGRDDEYAPYVNERGTAAPGRRGPTCTPAACPTARPRSATTWPSACRRAINLDGEDVPVARERARRWRDVHGHERQRAARRRRAVHRRRRRRPVGRRQRRPLRAGGHAQPLHALARGPGPVRGPRGRRARDRRHAHLAPAARPHDRGARSLSQRDPDQPARRAAADAARPQLQRRGPDPRDASRLARRDPPRAPASPPACRQRRTLRRAPLPRLRVQDDVPRHGAGHDAGGALRGRERQRRLGRGRDLPGLERERRLGRGHPDLGRHPRTGTSPARRTTARRRRSASVACPAASTRTATAAAERLRGLAGRAALPGDLHGRERRRAPPGRGAVPRPRRRRRRRTPASPTRSSTATACTPPRRRRSRDGNGNARFDPARPAEPFTDTNGNGRWDAGRALLGPGRQRRADAAHRAACSPGSPGIPPTTATAPRPPPTSRPTASPSSTSTATRSGTAPSPCSTRTATACRTAASSAARCGSRSGTMLRPRHPAPAPRHAARDALPRQRSATCRRACRARRGSTTSTTCRVRRPAHGDGDGSLRARSVHLQRHRPEEHGALDDRAAARGGAHGVRDRAGRRRRRRGRPHPDAWRRGSAPTSTPGSCGRCGTSRRTSRPPTRTSTSEPADVPYSERYQFVGDPRHSPYADTDRHGDDGRERLQLVLRRLPGRIVRLPRALARVRQRAACATAGWGGAATTCRG